VSYARILQTLALALAVAACSTKQVELGIADARIDAPTDAASTCRCRISPCRTAGDCALVGGTCGADLYCTGDFGACLTNADCQRTVTASMCTQGTTSTAPCP
jgi:hypothetical protein